MVTGLPVWASLAIALMSLVNLVGMPILDSNCCSLLMPAMPWALVQPTLLARSTASRRVGLRPYAWAKRTAAAGPQAEYASSVVSCGSLNWLTRSAVGWAQPPIRPSDSDGVIGACAFCHCRMLLT